MSARCHGSNIGSSLTRSQSQTLQLSASSSYSPATQVNPVQGKQRLKGSVCEHVPGHRRFQRINSQECRASSISLTHSPMVAAESKPPEQDNSFENMVQESATPILVDFYAPWCGPCQLMSKIVADISHEMQGDLKVMKINTDSYPRLASKYRIQALPTCLLFRDGKVIDRVDGFMPEPSFGKRIRFYVARLDKKFGRR